MNDTVFFNKILIAGDASRGKSTLAEKISKKLNIPFHSTDDFLYDIKYTVYKDRQKGIDEIFLGTFDKLEAAQRFYCRNGFELIPKQSLPAAFPLMQVDNRFFKRII